MFSTAGAAAASANRPCAFIAAPAVATRPYNGICGSSMSTSKMPVRVAAPPVDAPGVANRRASGATTTASGVTTAAPSAMMPRKPPATRSVDRASPWSMCLTSAGISSEDSIDPPSSP